MWSHLLEIDYTIFRWINTQLANSFFDQVVPIITDLHKQWWFAKIIFPLLIIYWIYRQRAKALRVILGLSLVVGFSDNFNSRFLKSYFQRPRPPDSGVEIIVRAEKYAGYSFPSSHASNMFSAMGYLSLVHPHLKFIALSIAGVAAFTRVYMGVHFPADVLGGAIFGLFYAFVFYKMYKILWSFVLSLRRR